MKIEFEVPDWAIGRHIRIFEGAELLGAKNVTVRHENGKHVKEYGPLLMKPEEGRCNGCGSCCSVSGICEEMLQEMTEALNNRPETGCPFRSDVGCIMRGWAPFSCLKSVCSDYDGCSEKLEEVSDGGF